MPLPFAPACIKVRLSGQQGAGEFGMVFHYRQASGADITDADANTFASNVVSTYGSNITPLVPPSTVLTSVVVEGLNSATDGVGANGTLEPGSNPGTESFAQVAVLEKDLVALRYRGGHPRHYWPAPVATAIGSPTTLSAAGVAAWGSAVTAYHSAIAGFLTALWGASSEYGAISYFSHHALRPSPLFMPILGTSIETTLATQRRRLGR